MSKGLRNKFYLILGVIIACAAFAWPINKRINLGLDLRGGMHLVLKVDTSKLAPALKEDAVLRAMEILRNRIDSLGVGETVIQRQGEDQILVQLPGVTDRDRAVDMVKRVAHLEFKIVKEDDAMFKDALAGKVPEGYELKYLKEKGRAPILLESKAVMGGEAITDARAELDQQSFYYRISLTFNNEGSKNFADLTQKHVGERLAIVMDNEVLSAPNIREPILTGTAEITGDFKFEDASMLALALRSGSLPVPIYVEEERTIGPLLGRDSIHSGIWATIFGSLFVVAFMIMYYWVGGMIASLALVVNLGMIIGAMGFINVMMPGSQVTLTLPGIAGIVLTLGMAVDANVLINERIREELENGRTLAAALSSGYDRALRAIIDTHVTSLVAAFLLFQFGSGPIKGFAVTLSIGLAASLFTAVYVSRAIFEYLLEKGIIKNLRMMKILSKKTDFNFLKSMYLFCVLSAVVTIGGLIVIMMKGPQAYGIDFSGGQVQQYRFQRPVSAEVVRKALKDASIKDAVIQQFDKNPENVIIRTSEDSDKQVTAIFKKEFPDNGFEIVRVEKVGPVVGKALRQRAIWAIALALGSILIYVGIRFKNFGFALAGVIALIHDILVALGLSVVLGRQIDLLVVTALLTIAGYSINDTIIVFDRVRENLLKNKKETLAQIINHSINQTLGRTILTTLVTLLVVVALFFFGGEVLNTFSLVLIIGFICGVYSTMYIVTPLVLTFQKDWK
ncbi:MAG: protein translocase subunit SecD [Candidatus Omnitrophica bacterium]|nr:protein translocase subunit SecD [Candidatus Omnitrophota bacterium]